MSDATADLGIAWLQHLRLALLRSMLDVPSRKAHESLLVDLVGAIGIAADREQVREQLVWLCDLDMVVAEVVHGSIVATLTEKGEWIAEGKRSHPDIKRPNVTAAVARKALDISLDRLKR